MVTDVHALISVVALGPIVAVALWTHSKAVAGPHAYEAALLRLDALPGTARMWTLGVTALLLAYGVLGRMLARCDRTALDTLPAARPAVRVLTLSGALSYAFIAWHMFRFSWPLASGEVATAHAYSYAAAMLSSTSHGIALTASGYALGLACLGLYMSLHLAKIAGARVTRPAALRTLTAAAWLVGFAVVVSGWRTTLHLAAGWPFDTPQPSGSCTPASSDPVAPRHPL
jgi:hypothetical protein